MNIRSFMLRHRPGLQDVSLILAALAVFGFLVFAYDVFEREGAASSARMLIEVDEVLLLGSVLVIGMLFFSIRRNVAQKDETQRRIKAETHARGLAFLDALTGLPNRRRFDDALKTAIGSPPRAGAVHGVFLLDLNGFKRVNDIYGHSVGDQVLIVVAQRLQRAVRDGDLVARFGGDEFAILAPHLVDAEAATTIAQRVIQVLAEPIATGRTSHQIGIGIGIAFVPNDATTVEECVRKADVALYRAKAERRSASRLFAQDMDLVILEREALEQALRGALAADSINVFFQPSMDLKTKQVVGFEAKPRWTHPTLGEIPPERFIPIAEDTGLIHELAEHLLRQACAAAVKWPAHVTLSIDIFPVQLSDRDLEQRITRVLAQSGLPPGRLELEITENALVQDLKAAQDVLGALRAAGVKIALDNFGTGYSSLYHFRNLQIDKIKIDRSFIEKMGSVRGGVEIVNALVSLAQGLGLTIAADGISDAVQQASLMSTGCGQGQGQLFSGIVSAEGTAQFFPADPRG